MKTTIKRRWFISVAMVIGLMAITNPSKEAYVEHVVWELKDSACDQQDLSVSIKISCATLNTLPPAMTMGMLNSYSRRHNFLLFSTYTTDFYGLEKQTIGLVGLFFSIF
ncbi:DUF4359 domain-containing protein [Kamptonema sp. UHCC 0994]|uniref:DUF4359 domain-containing protein n=1 Tax=Kamptonema sp. UHCC 0994 TaxID=3031329 RepID=UPI0023BA1247|nr:DUF4359 domain-containing protein [Kamptonema sp. UHCC 0994]MDF0554024.1 DUF4359 domain-containing protein [Kamptonema sp. UHCC 0994]